MSGLIHHAKQSPSRPAFVLGDGEFVETYGELEARSRHIALWLRGLGLMEGDCVAALLGNIPSFFDIYWATQRLGLYLTPLNWHLSAPEIAYIVENCDARVLIAGAGVGEVAAPLPSLLAGQLDGSYSVEGTVDGYRPLEPELARVPLTALEGQRAGSVMLYSSGTTGKPKGIRKALPDCAFDDPAWTQAQPRFVRLFGFDEHDRYLCPAPLYHAAPMRSCAAMQVLGATVHVMPKFDAVAALRTIERERITVSQWVPTHFRRLLDLPNEVRSDFDVSSLRVAVHAAAPCPRHVKEAMIDWWGPVLLEYYAGTEGGGTLIDSHEWLVHPGSVGRPWSGVDVRILDNNDAEVAVPGTVGAIYFRDRGAGITRFEYHKDQGKSAQVYRGEWFTLGDLGYRDADGFLYLTDRQSDMIISGGVNIYPQETENCLLMHPGVADAAVIGVPDEAMGEAVRAVVVVRAGQRADAAFGEELIRYARSQIAHYKCPRGVEFVDTLPRTETGKLQRRVLRDRHRETVAA
ncbi:AMP-binding protein [Sinimarinibacterium flocculans]|uniref:AMP-binding protein n=1 Tax=Sinimarinibacterium flocculans TaxID=985250 RepID=UPI00249321C7|nr:AMP-binding protein [Sinimarinibacterium flocculans]